MLNILPLFAAPFLSNLKIAIIVCSVFSAFAILWIVMYLLDRRKKKEIAKKKKPVVPLFTQLCKTHSLSASQSNLLKSMSSRAGLQPAEVVFVDPSLWMDCLEQSPHNRKPLLEIMEILFGKSRVQRWCPESSANEKKPDEVD